MLKIWISFFVALLCLDVTGFAGDIFPPVPQNARWIQVIESVSDNGQGVILKAELNTGDPVTLLVNPLTGNMVRIRANTNGVFDRTLQEKDGFIRTEWPATGYELIESDDACQIQLEHLTVSIQKDPFCLEFSQKGKPLTGLIEGKSILFNDETCQIKMATPPEEKFMGFGYQGSRYVYPFDPDRTPLNHRGHHVQMLGLTNQRAYYVPFFQSSRGYGFFLNTLTESFWDMAKTDPEEYSIKIDEPELDFYFIAGPRFKSILSTYTALTGRAPLPPKWRLGREEGEPVMFGIIEDGGIPYHGWNTQWYDTKQILHRANEMRDKDIPGDYYLLENSWQTIRNSFEWVSEIPDPGFLLDSLRKMHFKPALWERPTLHADDYALYNEAEKKGYLVLGPDNKPYTVHHNYNPDPGRMGQIKAMVDFTNPAAVKWWKKQLKDLIDLGGCTFKMDSEGSGWNENLVEAKETRWHNGMTGRELENYYGPLHMKVVFEALKEGLNGKRATLGGCYHQGYFASSKYPYMAFGDRNTHSNAELRIRPAINNAMCGIAYWHQSKGRGISFDGLPTVDDVHRIRLIPHTYSYWHIATTRGLPVIRPMILEFQDDPECYKADAQFMFGKEFLVAPGVKGADEWREVFPPPGREGEVWERGRNWRKVYLPEGEWVNYRTQEKYLGPGWQHFQFREDEDPILVRGGAIIPKGPFVEYIEQKPMNPIELEIYPCGESEFIMYEDDGETYDYESGAFALTKFTCHELEDGIEVRIHPVKGEFKGMITKRDYTLSIIGTTEPEEILVNGRSIDSWHYHGSRKHDDFKRILRFDIPKVDVKQGTTVKMNGAKPIKIYF